MMNGREWKWDAHIWQWQKSGLSQRRYCVEHRVPNRRLTRKQNNLQFIGGQTKWAKTFLQSCLAIHLQQ